jgi:prophage regulatory protein
MNQCQHKQSANQSERLLRLPQVEALVALRKSAIYSAVKAKTFPAPIVLPARAVAWPESQIQAWIADRIKASQKA